MDWIGWDSLPVIEQLAVLFWSLVFGVAAGASVLFAYALFGISPRRPAARKKAKKKRRKGRR